MTAATEINILDPDGVLLGGGVSAMRGFPTDLLTAKIREHTRKPYPTENLNAICTQDDEKKAPSARPATLGKGWAKRLCFILPRAFQQAKEFLGSL